MELRDRMQEQLEAHAEREKESKLREAGLAGKLALSQARLCDAISEAAKTKKEQLDAVLAESNVVSELPAVSEIPERCADCSGSLSDFWGGSLYLSLRIR